MKKLPEVERARTIMNQGMEWGIWKWLLEKEKVRGLADQARAALDELEMKVKLTWSDDLKIAYNHLVTENGDSRRTRRAAKGTKPAESPKLDARTLSAIKRVKDADDEAYNAHEDAEEEFADAEKKMSTSRARDAAGKALQAYDAHEAAIRKAEALANPR